MNEDVLSVLGTLFTVAGFIVFVICGARLADRLHAVKKWAPVTVGALFIVGAGALLFFAGQPFTLLVRTIAVFALAFGGGLVARERERIIRGR